MSKLSESVKQMQEADAKKSIDFWFNNEDKCQEFLDAFYDKLLNLEFDSLKSTNDFYIEIHPFLEFDGTLVAKLSKFETDYISIGLFPNASQEQYCLDKMYTVKFQVNSDKINIKELQYYCEKTAKAYTTCKMKSNEEKFKTIETDPEIEHATRILEAALKGLNSIFSTLDT